MAEVYRLYEESDYALTSKTTGAGQSQSWDAAKDFSGHLGAAKFTLANANAVYLDSTAFSMAAVQALGLRFYFDVSGLTFPNSTLWYILNIRASPSGYRQHFHIISDGSGNVSFRVDTRSDSGTVGTVDVPISAEPHWVEYHLTKSSTAATADATMTWSLDGVSQTGQSGFILYNNFADMASLRMGGNDSLDAPISGSIYVGAVIVRNDADPIGPFRSYRHRPRPAAIMKKRQRIKGYRCG